MKIDVRVFPVENPKGTTMAFATVTIDNKFTIRSVRVVNGTNGLFTAMPQEQDKDKNYRDIVHIENTDTYGDINQAVIGAYVVTAQRKSGNKQGGTGAAAAPPPASASSPEIVYEDPELPY